MEFLFPFYFNKQGFWLSPVVHSRHIYLAFALCGYCGEIFVAAVSVGLMLACKLKEGV